jgi:uncharacterized lipoprotein YehR (DUF1307 family)
MAKVSHLLAVKRYINIEKYSKGKTLDLINQTLENIVKHFSTVANTKEEAERILESAKQNKINRKKMSQRPQERNEVFW